MGRLVVAPNWIGDAVMSLPVLRALSHAAPEERLVVLARPGPAAIYRAEGTASAVTTASALLRDSLAARQGGFSEAWVLPHSYRSALVPFLAGIPERIGYATDGRSHLLTRAPAAPPRTGHQLRDYDRLLESRGIPPDAAPPRLSIPAEAAARADAELSRAGLLRNVDEVGKKWTTGWLASRLRLDPTGRNPLRKGHAGRKDQGRARRSCDS